MWLSEPLGGLKSCQNHSETDGEHTDRAPSRPIAVVVIAEGKAILALPISPACLPLELHAKRVRIEGGAAAHRDVLPSHILTRLEAHVSGFRGDLRALDGRHVARVVEGVAAVSEDVGAALVTSHALCRTLMCPL